MISKIAAVTKPLLHIARELGAVDGQSADRVHGVALTQPSRPNQPLHDVQGDAIFAPHAGLCSWGLECVANVGIRPGFFERGLEVRRLSGIAPQVSRSGKIEEVS
jgi:hypothetical protein